MPPDNMWLTNMSPLGSVLLEEFDREEHPVLIISGKLTSTKKIYTLEIKWAIEKLQYYLAGWHFTLVTDHSPPLWMVKVKDANAWVTWWCLSLQDFSF